jgi:hypothetical protein
VFRTRDVSDAPAPLLNQVLSGATAASLIVDVYKGQIKVATRFAAEHDRHVARSERFQKRLRLGHCQQDHGIDMATHKVVLEAAEIGWGMWSKENHLKPVRRELLTYSA